MSDSECVSITQIQYALDCISCAFTEGDTDMNNTVQSFGLPGSQPPSIAVAALGVKASRPSVLGSHGSHVCFRISSFSSDSVKKEGFRFFF